MSFSRPIESLTWGVPVPNDPSQVMYVWCDALTNYISALSACDDTPEFQKYWNEGRVIHCIGKDIVRFHAGIWIGMLLSAGIKVPDVIHIHGFLTSEGVKMSKSLGNVVDPFEYIEDYGADRLRYYLLHQIPTGGDGDFSQKQFIEIGNAHLSNGLGNLVNRVVVMSRKNGVCAGAADGADGFSEFVEGVWEDFRSEIHRLDTNKALIAVWRLVEFGNKQMDALKPWVVRKEDEERFNAIMKNFLELLMHVGVMIGCFLPETGEKILAMLGMDEEKIFPECFCWNGFEGVFGDL